MAEYPWPEAENYVYPTTVPEAIADERRLFPDTSSMLKNLGVLPALYEKDAIRAYYMYLARVKFVTEYDREAGSDTAFSPWNKYKLNNDFLSGALLGVHALVETNHGRDEIEHILATNPLPAILPQDMDAEQEAYIGRALKEFNIFSEGLWRQIFDEMIPEMRDALDGMVDLLYTGDEHFAKRGDDFKSGVLFALLSMARIKDHHTNAS